MHVNIATCKMGKLGKLQRSKKNKKLKIVEADYSNESRKYAKFYFQCVNVIFVISTIVITESEFSLSSLLFFCAFNKNYLFS